MLESCLEEQPHSHLSPPSLAVDVQVKQRMTRRETEPGPALVLLIQDTDSEEFLGKGRFSHTPDLLMHSLMLDTSHSPRTPLLHWLQGMGQDTRSALSLEDYTSS